MQTTFGRKGSGGTIVTASHNGNRCTLFNCVILSIDDDSNDAREPEDTKQKNCCCGGGGVSVVVVCSYAMVQPCLDVDGSPAKKRKIHPLGFENSIPTGVQYCTLKNFYILKQCLSPPLLWWRRWPIFFIFLCVCVCAWSPRYIGIWLVLYVSE